MMIGLLSKHELWPVKESLPIEMDPEASRLHIEDLMSMAVMLAITMQSAICLIDSDMPDEARMILQSNLEFLNVVTRLH